MSTLGWFVVGDSERRALAGGFGAIGSRTPAKAWSSFLLCNFATLQPSHLPTFNPFDVFFDAGLDVGLGGVVE